MTQNKKTILMVDDDEDFLWQQRHQFEKAGYQVITANDIEGAKALIQKESPDIAILDMMMDEEDAGVVLAHLIKKTHENVPVILVTAMTRETGMVLEGNTREDRSWLKTDKVLAKPVRFEQLLREVQLLVQ